MLRSFVLFARSESVIRPDARCMVGELESRLRPFITRRVSDPFAVDDVVQDTLLRMHRGLRGLRDDERFGTWLYQVARSAIADHVRDKARHPIQGGDAPELGADPAGPDESEAVECELAAYVVPFIAMLPTPYREALTLTELQGLTQREAAELMGVSLSGMKSRAQRGRERLRALIVDCCTIALDARGRVIACERRPGGRRPGDCLLSPVAIFPGTFAEREPA